MQKVFWKDPVTGKIRSGEMVDRAQVYNVIPMDEDGYLGKVQDVNRVEVTIKEEGTGKLYSFEEKYLFDSLLPISN